MSFYRKCLNWSQRVRLLTSFAFVFLVFDSVCVYAGSDLCTRVFGPNSHPFFEHLFSEDPTVSPDYIEQRKSILYRGAIPNTGQIAFSRLMARKWLPPFRKQPLNWHSLEQLNPNGATPQGDVRNFIYFAGQELAQRFGFEFRIEDGDVVLLVPDAERIAKTVALLNPILISRGQDPIQYLPIRAGFSRLGETLAMSNAATGVIEVRFPYADRDPDLAAHEVSYHLGALLYGSRLMKKAGAINREVERVIKLMSAAQLPRANYLAAQLMKWREGELDTGMANLQIYLTLHRRATRLENYTARDMEYFDEATASVIELAHPYYNPTEIVAMQVMYLAGVHKSFTHLDQFRREMDYQIDLNKIDINKIDMAKGDRLHYVPFVRNLLNSQDSNPLNRIVQPRQHAGTWTMEVKMGMEKRIKELIDAFDAIAKAPER